MARRRQTAQRSPPNRRRRITNTTATRVNREAHQFYHQPIDCSQGSEDLGIKLVSYWENEHTYKKTN